MEMKKLAGLAPERVFYWFEKICAIPHGSGNTKQISDFLVSFTKDRGLRYIQDSSNNVIIFKDAGVGYETHAPLILQGHMDMVCHKDAGAVIDMTTQGVDVMHDGTYVFAKGTTLGADDGIAVALCLAILEDDTIAHPPLEVVITSDEETGLLGANAIDLSMLRGRRMINLDTPYDNVFNVGCGGGCRVFMELPVRRKSCTLPRLRFTLEGLHGGHSGSQINKSYANANKVMALLLDSLQKQLPLHLCSLSGGTAGNVIPGSCQAVVAVDRVEPEVMEGICREFLNQLKENYDEPNAALSLAQLKTEEADALTEESTKRVIDFLLALPNGVQAWHPDFDGLPLTSLNLGTVELGDSLQILTALRSGINAEKQVLQERLRKLGEEHGCTYRESGIYSAWEYRKESDLRTTLVRLYRERYSEEPVVRVVHSGLECGVLSQKIPDLDCVSMGPTALEIHTTRERLDIASTERTWLFLQEILKAL